jgi:hypothetical protein
MITADEICQRIEACASFSNAEMFEASIRYLFTQGFRAYSMKGCMYRGYNRDKCGIGCIIPDSLYRDWMDPNCIADVLNDPRMPDKLSEAFNGDDRRVELLEELQLIHDDAYNWASTKKMRAVAHGTARVFRLDASFVDELQFNNRPQ